MWWQIAIILLVIFVVWYFMYGNNGTMVMPITNGNCDRNYLNLNNTIRAIWADHVFYTREYMMAAIYNTPNKQAILNRLLRNQEEMGNALGGIYGADVGRAATQLLKEHIMAAGAIVANMNSNRVAEYIANARANADQIADALSKIRIASYEDLQHMLYMHLDLLVEEAKAIAAADGSDVPVFDEVRKQADDMAQGFINGITNRK